MLHYENQSDHTEDKDTGLDCTELFECEYCGAKKDIDPYFEAVEFLAWFVRLRAKEGDVSISTLLETFRKNVVEVLINLTD